MRTLAQLKVAINNAGSWSDRSYPANVVADIQQAMIDLIEYMEHKEQIAIDTTRYQGFANRATWLVSLWIDNEQDTQQRAFAMARTAMVLSPNNSIDALAMRLKHTHEDRVQRFGLTGFASDLMQYALEDVDWQEVAEHIIAGLD